MRVIFMGTPDFAASNLEAIYKAGYEIIAVVSQPDKPVGRHSELKPTEVKRKAIELGISEILQPEKASDPEFIAHIRELKPDVIVVTAYGKILKKELLDIPKYGCINVLWKRQYLLRQDLSVGGNDDQFRRKLLQNAERFAAPHAQGLINRQVFC